GPTSFAPELRRTIESEKKYEMKFIAAAMKNAVTTPCGPAMSSPRPRSTPVISASNAVVLTAFMVVSNRSYQTGDERGAVGQRVHLHMFVERVRAVADRAEAI